jgi:ABC-2 type transport system permease protein
MMSKIWLVALNEYRTNVFKKSFLLVLFSVPLFLGFIIGFGLYMESRENSDAPLGYVDHSGLLKDPLPAPVEDPEDAITFISFQTVEEAKVALDEGAIQAYYLFNEDYPETRDVELVYVDAPGSDAVRQFYDFLQINLLSDQGEEVAYRGATGNSVTIRTPDGKREFPDGGPPFGVVLPIIIGLALMFLFMTASGFMMEGVATERENRTIEVIVTSISPNQMVAGKILGIVGISLTQLLAWFVFGAIALFIAQNVYDATWFQNPVIDWGGMAAILFIGIPTFFLATALMFTIGSTVANAQEGQGLGPILFMLSMSPSWFIMKIGGEPNGSFAIILSMVPFASVMTVGIRNMLIAVPWWQIALSAVIQTMLALFAIWLGGRAFRFGMLRVGQRVNLRELIRRVRPSRDELPQGGVS